MFIKLMYRVIESASLYKNMNLMAYICLDKLIGKFSIIKDFISILYI